MNTYSVRTWSSAILLTFLFPLFSHAQTCHWLKGATATSDDSSSYGDVMQTWASATDDLGNIYVAGDFSLDTILIGDAILVNYDSSSTNIFVAKYDSSGNVQWARSFGGNDDDEAHGIAVDASGNVYVSGLMGSSEVYFDTIAVNNPALSGSFLLKLNGSGGVDWVRAGTSGPGLGITSDGSFVATDPSGNIIVTGTFIDSLDLGGYNIYDSAAFTLTDAVSDLFIAKYNPSGSLLWAKGSIGGDIISDAITTDPSGNILVSGEYAFNAQFETVHISGGDNYVVKYNSTGDVIWAFSNNDNNFVQQSGLSTDAAGNIYAIGFFLGDSIVFGSTTLTNAGAPGSGTGDIFLVKFTPAGAILWAQRIGGSDDEEAHAIVADADGTTYICGSFLSSSLTFGTSTLNNPPYFVASYDAGGAALWGRGSDALTSAGPLTLSKDAFGHLYSAGIYNYTLILNGNTLPMPPNYSVGSFLAQYNDLPVTAGVQKIIGLDENYTLYPNPATKQINVDGSKGITALSITNLYGQVMYNGIYNDIRAAININEYPSGIYLVKINNSVIRKFVKE
jgi:hypothetical protein